MIAPEFSQENGGGGFWVPITLPQVQKRLAAFCGDAATTRLFLGLEPRISIYVRRNADLALRTGAG